MDERSFWPSVVYCIKTTKPLVQVLWLTDAEEVPAMAFIYGAMNECKAKIPKTLDNDIRAYKEIWKDLSKQLIAYNDKKGLFGYRGSMTSYMTRPPVKWWEEYGDDTPELKAFAIKILGLTCSASACERNWITFNQVHTKRRNRLTTKRMNKLVYVMYNRKLKERFLKKSKQKEEDALVIEHVMSDDEWIANGSDDDEEYDTVEAEAEVREVSEVVREVGASSSSRKRKGGQLNLIDEDTDDEVEFVEDDDHNGNEDDEFLPL
ncbi:hypothetical protein LXL04_007966 [Taraxacum kok-saghyz]